VGRAISSPGAGSPLSRAAPGILTVAFVLALIALAGLLYATRDERAS
jgi:hypothetical protein